MIKVTEIQKHTELLLNGLRLELYSKCTELNITLDEFAKYHNIESGTIRVVSGKSQCREPELFEIIKVCLALKKAPIFLFKKYEAKKDDPKEKHDGC